MHDEDGPVRSPAEKRPDGHLHLILLLPDHDPGFDPVGVAQAGPRRVGLLEFHDHVDALLLDAEGRDLGETRGFDPQDPAAERAVAAPAVDKRGLSGAHPHRIVREVVGHDFEFPRVPDLEQRLAGRNHRLALANPPQHDAVHRREDLDRFRIPRPGVTGAETEALHPGPGDRQLAARIADREFGRLQRFLAGVELELRDLELLFGGDTLFLEAAQAVQRGFGERALLRGLLMERLGLTHHGFRGFDCGLGFRSLAGVERHRGRGQERGEHALSGQHPITRFELDAEHAPGHRRRNLEPVPDPGFSLFVERHRERPAHHRGHVHRHRAGP